VRALLGVWAKASILRYAISAEMRVSLIFFVSAPFSGPHDAMSKVWFDLSRWARSGPYGKTGWAMPGAVFSSPSDEPEAHRASEYGGFLMGVRNYLIEGVSGTGKPSVCNELRRRGYHSSNGDRELAYQGDPKTGEPLDGFAHAHHIWDVEKVRALVADQSHFRHHSFAAVPGISTVSSIYSMEFLFLRSIWTR
jgi:hypothetical protein